MRGETWKRDNRMLATMNLINTLRLLFTISIDPIFDYFLKKCEQNSFEKEISSETFQT